MKNGENYINICKICIISQEALTAKPGGSFLLRYSDSEIGGLTIAWVSESDKNQKQVRTSKYVCFKFANRFIETHELLIIFDKEDSKFTIDPF